MDGKIVGYGPKALSRIFTYIGSIGVTEIRTMSEERFDELFGHIDYDDSSVEKIISALLFLRNPAINIDHMIQNTDFKINEHWMWFIDQLFTERFMKEFESSTYFDLLAENSNADLDEIIKAWFDDLRNGLMIGNVHHIMSMHCGHKVDTPRHESEIIFSKIVLKYDLSGELKSIPFPMLMRADLWNVLFLVTGESGYCTTNV